MKETDNVPVVFDPISLSPVVYIWVNRSTNSDVMSTAVTTRISTETIGTSAVSKRLKSAVDSQNTVVPFHVQNKKRTRQLVQERDKFMASLKKERETRQALEHWAATKLQRGFRDYMMRPHAVQRRTEVGTEAKESLKEQILRMAEETHRKLTFHEQMGDDNGDKLSQWQERARRKTIRRQRKRQLKTIERMATLLFQTLVRGYLVRKAMRAIRTRNHLQRQQQACLVVQCAWRLHAARTCRAERKANVFGGACVRIQRLVRGTLSRARATRLYREKVEREARHTSATKINSMCRGRIAKKVVEHQKSELASTKVQGLYRRHLSKVRRSRVREKREKCAIVIQTKVRGVQSKQLCVRLSAKKRIEKEVESATKIQKHVRAANSRKKAKKRRKQQLRGEELAATRIQSTARVRIAKNEVQTRRKLRGDNNNATKIQSVYRGKVAKRKVQIQRELREVEVLDTNAIKIQSLVRGNTERRKFDRVQSAKMSKRTEEASKKIQALQRRRATAAVVEVKRNDLRSKLQSEFLRMQKSQRRVVRRRSPSEGM